MVRVFSPQNEPITHTHRFYRLEQEDWLLAASFDASLVPAGASYGYNFSADSALDQNLAESLLPAVGVPSFTYLYVDEPTDDASSSASPSICTEGGLHVNETSILLNENGIWWFESSDPTCDIEMVTNSADTKGVSLLHTIESLSSGITIDVTNGRVKVTLEEFTETLETAGHIVVKDILGHDKKRGPVVEKIQVGAGLAASSPEGEGQGTVTLQLSQYDDLFLNADILNLNNSITTVESPYVITKFPTNRNASITGRVTLPELGSATYKFKIFAQFLTPGSSQPGPDLSDVTKIPTPDAAGVTPVGEGAGSFPAFPSSVSAGDVYLIESDDEYELDGFTKGTIMFTVGANKPSTELRMINVGIRLFLA
jgi:hypothetical protein